MIGSGAEPSGNKQAVQAGARLRRRACAAFGVLCLLLLSGCASAPAAINPVDWYHDIEGGPISRKQPPIPGANAPYPNLANVPQPPQYLPPAERDAISAALLAQRTHAERQALLAPLPASSATQPASPAPAPAQPPTAPPAAAGASPAPTSPPTPAADEAPPPPSAALAAAAASLPAVPAAPPPPPAIAGFPPPPGPPPTPFSLARPAALIIHFAAGSSALSAAERARIARIAAARGKASIAVVGYGDASASDAAAQQAALGLGLSRARVIATALASDGVPESALRLGAEASGGGATLRLLQNPGAGT